MFSILIYRVILQKNTNLFAFAGWLTDFMISISVDDTRKLSTLQLLAGYLKLLGPRVTSLVNSYSHLSRLMQAIVQVCTLYTLNCMIPFPVLDWLP